jgi:hypothetical protein
MIEPPFICEATPTDQQTHKEKTKVARVSAAPKAQRCVFRFEGEAQTRFVKDFGSEPMKGAAVKSFLRATPAD